ncbi:MAG: 16S rRNA (uracil(1498)-N(3))-methyltransferase [Bacteroidota bacterium]|nr:16S rRNA (uracil(1498)-N(3))-methyltransferase [Bacteroidota bacterium]
MQVFYLPGMTQGLNVLNPEESHHCSRVLRTGKEEEVNFIDGEGGFATGKIIQPHPRKTIIEIREIKTNFNKRSYYLHIAIAPTKNIDRFEWFLEKAVEIGIDEITPLICERSERRTIKTERLNKRILSAMKQSMNAFKPRLNELTSFKTFLNQINEANRYIAYRGQDAPPQLKEQPLLNSSSLILIGPEGDFSPGEVKMALKNNIKQVGLGPSRLRTETAGIVCCHTTSLLNQ